MRRIAARIERDGTWSVMNDMFMGYFIERELLFWPICYDTNNAKNRAAAPFEVTVLRLRDSCLVNSMEQSDVKTTNVVKKFLYSSDIIRCNVWVSVCGGVLTVVWAFWQYVYLYLLCFVLFLL
jgi:hypothetical protein